MRETELNHGSIFSTSSFNESCFFSPMVPNRVKLKCTVILIKYIASVIQLICPPKTLIFDLFEMRWCYLNQMR